MSNLFKQLPEEVAAEVMSLAGTSEELNKLVLSAWRNVRQKSTSTIGAVLIYFLRKLYTTPLKAMGGYSLQHWFSSHGKTLNIEENGSYIVKPDDGHLLNSVKVNVDTTESVMLDYVRKGGKFARCQNVDTIAKMMDFSKMESPDFSYMFEESKMSWEHVQTLLNLMTDENSWQEYMDGVDFINVPSEAFLRMPDGFKNTKGNILISANIGMPSHLTIDMNNLEHTGTLFGWTDISRLTLLNTKQLKSFYNPTSTIGLDAFDCDSLESTPYNGMHNQTDYIGGFINLGKGFKQNGSASAHTMFFDAWMQNLSHDSLVNIFNGLYDLNLHTFKFTNQPTIQLGSKNYARLSADEIKIATDKGWIVTQ